MKFGDAGERRPRIRERRDPFDRDAPAVRVERVGRVPSDIGGAGDSAGRLGDVHAVHAHAGAIEAQRRRRLLKRLAVRRAVVDGHRAKANRPRVLAREVEVARQQTGHGVFVDLKRMAQADRGHGA